MDPETGMRLSSKSSILRREKFNSTSGVSFCRNLGSQAVYQIRKQGCIWSQSSGVHSSYDGAGLEGEATYLTKNDALKES